MLLLVSNNVVAQTTYKLEDEFRKFLGYTPEIEYYSCSNAAQSVPRKGDYLKQSTEGKSGKYLHISMQGMVPGKYDISMNCAVEADVPDQKGYVTLDINGKSFSNISTYSGGLFSNNVAAFTNVEVASDGILDISFNVGVTNSASVKTIYTNLKSLTFNGGTPLYMYNKGSKSYLDCGDLWGTHAVVGHGRKMDMTLANGVYSLKTTLQDGTAYFGYDNGNNQFWLDLDPSQKNTNCYLEGNNVDGFSFYAIKDKSNKYLVINSTDGISKQNVTSVTDDYGKWVFVTEEKRVNELTKATLDAPIDATFLIASPGFTQKDTDFNRWTFLNTSSTERAGYDGKDTKTNNYNLKIAGANFEMSQTLENIPNGWYILSAQGFTSNSALKVELFANNLKTQFDYYNNSPVKTVLIV